MQRKPTKIQGETYTANTVQVVTQAQGRPMGPEAPKGPGCQPASSGLHEIIKNK